MFSPSLCFVNGWWNLRNSNKEERRSEERFPLDQREEEMFSMTRMTSAEQQQMHLWKDTSKSGPRCGSPSLRWSSTWNLQRITREVPEGEILTILLILGSGWVWGPVTSSVCRAIRSLLWSNLLQKITAFDFTVSDSAQSSFKLLSTVWVFGFLFWFCFFFFLSPFASGRKSWRTWGSGRALQTLAQNFTFRGPGREPQACVFPGEVGRNVSVRASYCKDSCQAHK